MNKIIISINHIMLCPRHSSYCAIVTWCVLWMNHRYEYGKEIDILFNSLKYNCFVFNPRRYHLHCHVVAIGSEILKRVHDTKYICALFKKNRRRRHAQANQMYVPRTLCGHCTVDVKIVLCNSYCTSLYCSFSLTDFKKSTFSSV